MLGSHALLGALHSKHHGSGAQWLDALECVSYGHV